MGKYNNCSPVTKVYKDGIMIGVGTIKGCNQNIANELMNISGKKNFIELLDAVSNTSINTAQLRTLVGLGYFSDYGKNGKLLTFLDAYNGISIKSKTVLPSFRTCKQISKDKIDSYMQYGIKGESFIKKFAGKETAKLYKDIDNIGLLTEMFEEIPDKALDCIDQIKLEMDSLQYTTYSNGSETDYQYVVVGFKTYSDKSKPYAVIHNISTGEEKNVRIKSRVLFNKQPFGMFSVLEVFDIAEERKKKYVDGEWKDSDEIELILKNYECVRD
jgi:hypothetical protein